LLDGPTAGADARAAACSADFLGLGGRVVGGLEAPEEAGCGGHGGHDGRDLEGEIDPRMKEEGGESGEAA
jgi:hypothetical protein